MATYFEELESMLDGVEMEEFEERSRRRAPTVRTPTRQSSFVQRATPSPASQTQVQTAARNLDAKIETLTAGVKALETRTNTLAAEQDKQGVLLRKEVTDRRKTADGIRGDLQQTKMLAVMLPLLTQETVDATDANGAQVKVVTQSQNQLASILPFLLLMQPGYGGGADGAKGPFGDSSTMLLMILLLSRR
jgi:predicted RNase H-like nuclease (RuvC/YqgF family)